MDHNVVFAWAVPVTRHYREPRRMVGSVTYSIGQVARIIALKPLTVGANLRAVHGSAASTKTCSCLVYLFNHDIGAATISATVPGCGDTNSLRTDS